jgi:hypothetical protein
MINRLLPSLCSVIRLTSVVLVAGVGLSVSVQGQAFQCLSNSVPTVARAEGFAEPMGDLIVDCTGGIPTPPNQAVPTVDIAVNLDSILASKVTAVVNQVQFLESLLIVDEPNSLASLNRPILNCGRTEAPDNTAGGPGVCSILGGGSLGAASTYDGSTNHPNVFQGRSLRLITGQANQVVFSAIPIDPPGTICPNQVSQPVCHRIIRITNIRADAAETGVITGSNQTSSINAQVIATPPQGLPLGSPSLVVARVQAGLIEPSVAGSSVFIREAFSNSFKPRSLTQILANGGAVPYTYSGIPNAIPGINHNQNVPGTSYDTESTFTNSLDSAHGNNPLNPLVGGAGAGIAFSNQGGIDTGITNAGIADSGTRFALQFDIPAGASMQVPQVVQLTNVVTHAVTGVTVLTTTDSSGAGPFSPATGTLTAANNTAVYEVLFANPGALEGAEIPITLLNAPPNTTLHVTASFAPFFPPNNAVRQASTTLAVPRFISSTDALCLVGACISISPNLGPNSGPIGVAIFGDPILTNAQVKLSRAGFPDILGTATSNSTPSLLTTTFDLTGAPAGPRDIVVTPQTGAPVTYSGLFQIFTPRASCSYEVGGPRFENNFFRPLVFPASGGPGDLVVTPTPSTCPWEASSSVPWITLPPKSNSVTQPYIVDPNPSPDARGGFGLITVAGQSIYVFQHGACTIDISPGSEIFDVGGGSVSVNVTAPAGCPWSAVSNASWLTVSAGASGSGNGSVTLQAAPNAGGPRSAQVGISNPNAEPKTFSANQSASACGATDVSSQASVVRGVFLLNFLGTSYTQQIKLTNNGPAIPGPVYLVVDGLVSASVTPTARTTTCQSSGTSYMVLAAANGLNPGQVVNLNLTFRGTPPTGTTLRVFSGTPSQ